MTTQHPEALRLAAELDDGYPLTGDAISAAAELRSQHARITELEAQLSAIGAGGVSPLIAQQTASPTAGMNIAQRILHVGGRNNDAGYVEFGSIQAVEALVRQVLRDLPARADSVLEDAARWEWVAAHWKTVNFRFDKRRGLLAGFTLTVDATKTGDGAAAIEREIDAAMNKGGSA